MELISGNSLVCLQISDCFSCLFLAYTHPLPIPLKHKFLYAFLTYGTCSVSFINWSWCLYCRNGQEVEPKGQSTAIVSHANFLPFTMALCETRVKMPWQQFEFFLLLFFFVVFFFLLFLFSGVVCAFFEWRLTLQLLRKN